MNVLAYRDYNITNNKYNEFDSEKKKVNFLSKKGKQRMLQTYGCQKILGKK